VRPPLKSEDPGYDLIPQRFRGSTCHVTTPTNLTVESAQGKKLFVFDRVFGEDVDQEGVWEYLRESVGSFLQGYNVSILAYGQSGAGKSYTMGTTGPAEQGSASLMGTQHTCHSARADSLGIVPRAAAALFDKLTPATGARSGIKSPNRYSMNAMTSLSSYPAKEKNWKMTATYVEVCRQTLMITS
jgi:kinesin family protein 4/21/27